MTLTQAALLAFVVSIPFNLAGRWLVARSAASNRGFPTSRSWFIDTAFRIITSVLYHVFMVFLVIELIQKSVEIPVVAMVAALEVVSFFVYNPVVVALRQATER